MEELVVEYHLPLVNITGCFLIVGGDHGQGAFRLCFRALLTVRGREAPVYKTKAIIEVYCKKEEWCLLDESVIPWVDGGTVCIREMPSFLKEAHH